METDSFQHLHKVEPFEYTLLHLCQAKHEEGW